MKKILGLCFILALGLSGCSSQEKATEELVKSALKDPESAKFKNVVGVCGEVNSKNSYGGYTGFKSFYISDGVVVFREEGDDRNSFEYGLMAFCQDWSKLSNAGKQKCVHLADTAFVVVAKKKDGVSKNAILDITKSEKDRIIYESLIHKIYNDKNATDPSSYSLDVLHNCLDGKIESVK